MTLKLWISVFALILVAGVALAPAVAQKAKDGQASPPAADQMTQMLTMMEQIQEQMKGMHEQQHRAEMEKVCPAMPAPGAQAGRIGR
jgi:hypothetical protein